MAAGCHALVKRKGGAVLVIRVDIPFGGDDNAKHQYVLGNEYEPNPEYGKHD